MTTGTLAAFLASTFVVMSFGVYRLVRLALTDNVFDRPRDAFHEWLQAGQTLPERRVGVLGVGLVWLTAALIVGGHLVRWATGEPRLPAADLKWMLVALTAAGLGFTVIGCRNWLYDLVTCQFCLGVWASAAATVAVFSVVDGVPFVVGAVFALAVAGGQTAVHLVEDMLTGVIELLDNLNDVHTKRRLAELKAEIAERAAAEVEAAPTLFDSPTVNGGADDG